MVEEHELAAFRTHGVPTFIYRRRRAVRLLAWALVLSVVLLVVLPIVLLMAIPKTASGNLGSLWRKWSYFLLCWGVLAYCLYLLLLVGPMFYERWFGRRLAAQGYNVCPICDYCLDYLPDRHRCPECGVAYDRAWVRAVWEHWHNRVKYRSEVILRAGSVSGLCYCGVPLAVIRMYERAGLAVCGGMASMSALIWATPVILNAPVAVHIALAVLGLTPGVWWYWRRILCLREDLSRTSFGVCPGCAVHLEESEGSVGCPQCGLQSTPAERQLVWGNWLARHWLLRRG